MKLQLSLCAKDLPVGAKYRAVVVSDNQSTTIGETEVSVTDTTNPEWSKLIVADLEQTFSVQVYQNDSAIASASFGVDEILTSPHAAVVKFTSESDDKGAKIGVHASEAQNRKLRLVLAAKDLPDTDFGLGILRKQHSDPFYELYANTGKKLATSNVVQDNLCPTWDAHSVELDALCGNDMSAFLRIAVLDEDSNGSKDFLGQAVLSVNKMLELSSSKETVGLVKGGRSTQGSLVVKEATLLPQEHVSREAAMAIQAAMEALVNSVDEVQANAAKTAKAAAEAQKKAESANEQADALAKTASEAAAKQGQAHQALVDADKATEQATEAAKQNPCSGSLRLQLAAKNLPDTDLGFRNKTDPIYEIYNPFTSKKVMCSNVVENNLNPTWDVVTIDLMELCNGQLGKQIQITVSDKDRRGSREYLGLVKKSANELLQAKPTDALVLENSAAQAHVFVLQAELVDYHDLQEEATKCQAACDVAKAELQKATASFRDAQQEADAARAEAATAMEAAQKAQDQAEAAKLALAMMEKASLG